MMFIIRYFVLDKRMHVFYKKPSLINNLCMNERLIKLIIYY